jgi:plasmid stabilization system protein ParE
VKVVLVASAIADLESIADWIAADSPQRAASFIQLLRQRCLQLADTPRAYPLVPRYESEGIRRRPVGDYLIFYRLTGSVVEIVHVLHGARDIEALLFPQA